MKEKIRHDAHFDEVGKVHAKYMVVVPKKIRQRLGIKIGDKVVWERKAGKAELRPLRKSQVDWVKKGLGIVRIKDWKSLERAMKKVEEEDAIEVD